MVRPLPKVSVICTTYNQAQYLPQAINSVLGQTYADFELIIIDDGSTDNTHEIVGSFQDQRISYFWQENQERSSARNKGIELSRGQHLTFLDADDLYFPLKLASQSNELDLDPEAGMVSSGWMQVDKDCVPIQQIHPWRIFPEPTLRDWLLFGLTVVGANLIRREFVEKVGGFDRDLNAMEDTYLWYELIRSGCKSTWVPENVMMQRIHPANTSLNATRMRDANLIVLTKIFNDSDLEETTSLSKSEAFSHAYLNSCFRYLNLEKTENAKDDLSLAIHSDPSLLDNRGERILYNLWSWANSPKINNSAKFIELFLNNLPNEIARMNWNRTRINAGLWIDQGFSAYWQDQMKIVRESFVKAILIYPGWIKNRGVLSKLIESIFGKKIVSKIRRLIRRVTLD